MRTRTGALVLVEERLILPDRLPLVVEDGPPAAHPAAGLGLRRIVLDQGCGANFPLNLAAEAVGIAEAALDMIGQNEVFQSGMPTCDGTVRKRPVDMELPLESGGKYR